MISGVLAVAMAALWILAIAQIVISVSSGEAARMATAGVGFVVICVGELLGLIALDRLSTG